jgi:Domain of Unknown Function (DUF1206)
VIVPGFDPRPAWRVDLTVVSAERKRQEPYMPTSAPNRPANRAGSQHKKPMRRKASGKAEQAGDSTSLELVARAGLIAYGVVHLLIGWLAVKIAWSASGKSADTSGALKTLASQPFGKILLWLVAIGLIALALWQASEAVWGYRNSDGAERVRKRATSAASAVIYAALGFSAASTAMGSGASSSQSQKHATSGVLAWPGGRVVVVVAGLIIIGVGVAHVTKGVKKSFAEEIDTSPMAPAARKGVAQLGQVGYIAKGVALGLVGGLLSYATLTAERQKQGLDGAMQTILAQPFGKFLLTAAALGFVAFGVFAILQSRYRRM